MTDEERRKYRRLKRPLIVSYKVFGDPEAGYDVTQIKDISLGGMRFTTAQFYQPDTILSVELKTPFMDERLKLKAKVIESKEVAQNLIYVTRVSFTDLEKDELEMLNKVINLFSKSAANSG